MDDKLLADLELPDTAHERGAPMLTSVVLPPGVDDALAALPTAPGCYIFRDAKGVVLYVGKARNLRDRVRSYFRHPDGLSLKNRGLVPRIASVDYVIVRTNNEALLREFNLIKEYRPKYNILLKDDKSYPLIRITPDPYPRIEVVRRRFNDGSRYFGPYSSSQAVHRTLDLLKRLFPTRTCRLNIVPPGTGGAGHGDRAAKQVDAKGKRPPREPIRTLAGPQNRACLEHYIHRCAGPCIDAISQPAYGAMIEQAARLLQGRSEQVIAQLERDMDAAAEQLDFERAARLRDQIVAVRRVTERQHVTALSEQDQDVVGIARADDEACVELIAVREGRMLDHKQFVLKGTADQSDGAVLTAFLAQFYLGVGEPPDEVVLPAEPDDGEALRDLLSGRRGKKVDVRVPQRGDRRALVEMANKSAQEAAEQRKQQWLNDTQRTTQALADLQAALGLERLPLRIECYDISTIQGTSTVGSMVVFENGKPKTAAYRRFRIRTVTGTDDFASMAEMVGRRFRRAGAAPSERQVTGHADGAAAPALGTAQPHGRDRTERAEGTEMEEIGGDGGWAQRPDLMIIDGGKGQLGAAIGALEALAITDQPIVSLAKQREELFLPGRADPILLPAHSQALFLVQRVRDEAHRFAITYHRNVRGKRSLESTLDDVQGVGGKRKRDLLRRFGSLAGLRRAGIEELASVPGIGLKTAQAIKEQLGDA